MRITRAILLCTLALWPVAHVSAQAQPAVAFDTILETVFGDSNGRIVFEEYDVIFAPEGPATLEVVVLDAEGTVVTRHKALDDYRRRELVFARAMLIGPAEVTLKAPGIYTMVFLNEGEPITRCAFRVTQTSSGDDPFNPVKSFRFDGPWQQYGYITTDEEMHDKRYPLFNLWMGGIDISADEDYDRPYAELSLNGKVFAHSKRDQGTIKSGHFDLTNITLFMPHDQRGSPNALVFGLEDFTEDGVYDLKVARQSDNTVIRHFRVTVKDGAIQPHPRSELELESHVDYLAPRVVRRGSSNYEFIEATWIESGREG